MTIAMKAKAFYRFDRTVSFFIYILSAIFNVQSPDPKTVGLPFLSSLDWRSVWNKNTSVAGAALLVYYNHFGATQYYEKYSFIIRDQ